MMMLVVLVFLTGDILPHPPKGHFPNAERALFQRRKGTSQALSGHCPSLLCPHAQITTTTQTPVHRHSTRAR